MSTINLPADKFDTVMVFTRPETPPTRVALDKLAVLPGFNTRVKDAEYKDRVSGIAESVLANGFFDDKPFAVTMLPGDDKVYIYDGEHRFDAVNLAALDGAEFADGLPVAWAKDGSTVRDLTIHLAHGNNGERLNMVELAAVVRRMQGLGMSKDEIATALGRTTRHVDNLFVLAAANQTVKKAVASGQIAGAEAVKLLRKDPATAATKITEAIQKAVEKGKAKATPASMAEQPKGPPTRTVKMSLAFSTGKTVSEMLKAMATEIRQHVEFDGEDLILTEATLDFSVTTVDRAAEAAAIQREKDRAAAAVQREETRKAKEAEKAEKAAAAAKAKKDREAEKAKAAKAKETEAAKKRAAEAKLLAEAAKPKPAAAKPAAAKPTKPVKAASGGKAAKAPEKPAKAAQAPAATPAAQTPENVPSGPESGAPEGTDDNHGL